MIALRQPPAFRRLLRRVSALAAFVLVGVICAAFLERRTMEAPLGELPADGAPASIDAEAPRALAAHPRGVAREPLGPRRFSAGDVLRWTVVARSDVLLAVGMLSDDEATASAADRRVRLAVTGTLEARVFAADPDGVLVGFVLEDAALVSDAGPAPGETPERPEPALGTEILAQLTADGRVRAIAFPPGLREELRAVWRDLLARWQVALPPFPDAEAWDVDEFDPSGPYVASYRRDAAKGPHALEKRKTRVVAGLEVEGATRIRLRARAEEIVWDERASLRPTAAFEARVDASFEGRVALVAERRDAALRIQADERRAAAAHWGLEALGADAMALGEAGEADGAPLPGIADALVAVEDAWGGQGDVTAARSERLATLVRVLHASDAGVPAVVERLRDRALPEPVAAALAGALASAGTSATARALAVVLVDGGVPEPTRYAAVVATALHDAPTREIDVALRAVIDADRDGPLLGAALLARGAVAEAARATDPTWHADVVRALGAEASAATDLARLAVVMEAIGNAAPETPPAGVLAAMRSDDPERRAAALRALRNTGDEVAFAQLRAAFTSDPDDAVRRGALEIALEEGHPLRCTAIEHLTTRETSELVREAAAALAGGGAGCAEAGR